MAVVVPERKVLEEWAAGNSVEAGDFPSLCRNLKARKFMLDELNKTAREHKVHTSERFFIIYVSLTIVIDIIV